MSEATIHKAIVAVMREIGAIGKDETNEQQKYKYRSVEQVYNRVQPLFAKHGIFSYPQIIEQSREMGKTKSGGTMHYAILTVTYTFVAEDGSSIAVTVVGEGMDPGDKASNKAMAAAHKYAICQVLNIPYEVVDPDAHTPEWASALNGGVTLKELDELKMAWFAKQSEAVHALDRDKRKAAFASWVKATLGTSFDLGGALDVGDFRKWSREEMDLCRQALEETADSPAELDQWLTGIKPLATAQECQEFRDTVLSDCPAAIRSRVEEALAEHEKSLEGSP